MSKLTFNCKTQIGGYNLPADFPYITENFLSLIGELDFEDKVKAVYEFISAKILSSTAFDNIKNAEIPLSIVPLDGFLSCVELTGGDNANYLDYIFDKSDKLSEIYSLSALLIAIYSELLTSGVISLGDKINFAFNGDDGRLLLACYLVKKACKFIDVCICGSNNRIDDFISGVYFQTAEAGEVEEITLGVYEETDYLLDPISAVGMIAEDLYYADYDDDNHCVLLSLASPYYFSRKILKNLTDKNEISIDKAINSLYLETALEIPNAISSKKTPPFFEISSSLSVKDAIAIIKGSI